MDDARFRTELRRFWDEIAGGGPASRGDLDPESAETIRQLHALDDVPPPDPTYATRLRERLMHAATIPLPLTDPHVRPDLNGRSAPPVRRSALPLPTPPGRWALAQITVAALLVLTLVGTFFAFGPGRLGRPQLAPAFLPAIEATPATAESDGVATQPLLDLVIPTITDNTVFVVVEHYTMPPATTLKADMRRGRVPTVFFVANGTVKARVNDAPQPARVIRAGGAEPEAAAASGESVTLAAGDGFVLPENGTADLMNLASEPAIVLLPLLPANVDFPSGDTTIVWKGYGGNVWNASAPLALALKQVTLAPGAEIPGADAPNVKQIVGLVDPDRMMDARTTSTGALRNAGDEPLEAYVLTVTSGATLNPVSNGTPMTQRGVTPAP